MGEHSKNDAALSHSPSHNLPLLGEVQAQEHLNVGRTTLHRLVTAGDIKKVKIGGENQYAKRGLDAYLEQQGCEAAALSTSCRWQTGWRPMLRAS